MATFLQKIQFAFVKKQILSRKTDENIRLDLAREFAQMHSDIFMSDPSLLSFLYSSVKKQDTLIGASEVLFELFVRQPKKSIGQKNLMVTIRRIAIGGNNEVAQKAASILIERNDPKTCLGSKYFMEMIDCLASFDEDGTVTRILDDLEAKLPVETEKSESFAQARANNIESLTKQDPDSEIDLTVPEDSAYDSNNNQVKPENIEDFKGLSNLWAVRTGEDYV